MKPRFNISISEYVSDFVNFCDRVEMQDEKPTCLKQINNYHRAQYPCQISCHKASLISTNFQETLHNYETINML